MDILIREAANLGEVPRELLLLADPSRVPVEAYLNQGSCFLAFAGAVIVGEFVLLETAPGTVEIINVAVSEDYQGRGIGKLLVLQAIEEAKLPLTAVFNDRVIPRDGPLCFIAIITSLISVIIYCKTINSVLQSN